MGQFLIQVKGTAIVATFPYHSSLERGATMHNTEEWLMGLPPASFNQFANGAIHAVRLVENSVVWIPYGWVTVMVNCVKQLGFPKTLVIPYLNAKLAVRYPSLGMLANFHIENVKANQAKGHKYWTEHGDGYIEWLGTLNQHPEDSQLPLAETRAIQPALMDENPASGPDASASGEEEDTGA